MIFSGTVTIYRNICKIPEISLPPCTLSSSLGVLDIALCALLLKYLSFMFRPDIANDCWYV